jgi:hypothetical protein
VDGDKKRGGELVISRGALSVYRLEPSELEIHFAMIAIAKLAPTSDIAFHDQLAGTAFFSRIFVPNSKNE